MPGTHKRGHAACLTGIRSIALLLLLAVGVLASATQAAPLLYAMTTGTSGNSPLPSEPNKGLRTVAADGTVAAPTITGVDVQGSGLAFDSKGNAFVALNSGSSNGRLSKLTPNPLAPGSFVGSVFGVSSTGSTNVPMSHVTVGSDDAPYTNIQPALSTGAVLRFDPLTGVRSTYVNPNVGGNISAAGLAFTASGDLYFTVSGRLYVAPRRRP